MNPRHRNHVFDTCAPLRRSKHDPGILQMTCKVWHVAVVKGRAIPVPSKEEYRERVCWIRGHLHLRGGILYNVNFDTASGFAHGWNAAKRA